MAMKVLVVEDNDDVRAMVVEVLRIGRLCGRRHGTGIPVHLANPN
jgi:CheY-like chemotaxis protein